MSVAVLLLVVGERNEEASDKEESAESKKKSAVKSGYILQYGVSRRNWGGV